jgi:hypothetical protein
MSNKKLYYTNEKEVSNDGETLNGLKTVDVYEIIDNVPTKLCQVDGSVEDKSSDLIQMYLDDNGMGDDDFEFIQL